MPPRKKTRSTLKRSSSDLADDHANPKRPRADDGEDVISNISLDTAAAPRVRKPTTYKSKARQKAGLGIATPPRLTNFGFNLENKPKLGRALFHLSPSPRAKAKRSKVFASPKASRKRPKAKGGANTSAETSRMEITVDEEEQHQAPEESTSKSTLSDLDDEADQPRPLPVLSAIRPIQGPGLEIRTPLVGRVIPTLQSLSKRAQTTPIPLFAATPRQPVSQLPPITDDDNNPPPSPTKSNMVPIFAPTPSHAPPVPSTPAHKPRSIPIFTPSVNRTQDSPTKKFPPVFAPTENSLTSMTTPAHPNIIPTAPPKLPALSAALPATDIPETPTAKGRSLPTFTPKLLFPPPIVEEPQERAPVSRVSKAPVFGGVLEDEESTPRASRQVEHPQQTPEMRVEKTETKPVEEVEPEQIVEVETKPVEEDEPADVSMADLFNSSTLEFTPRSERVLCGEQGFFAPPQAQDESECIPSSQPSERVESSQPLGRIETSEPEIKHSSLFGARMTRSRSRSESAPASGSATRGGSVAPSRAGSVALSGADSQASQTKAPSRAPSLIPENEPVVSKSRRNSAAPKSRENSVPPKKRSRSRSVVVEIPVSATSAPHSASALTPIVTDQPILAALGSQAESRMNSMDEYRTSPTAAMMMDTPADAGTPSFPDADSMNPETSPLSSIPDDMSFSFMNHGDTTVGDTAAGDTTAGDTTMRDAGDATVRQDQDGDASMQIRDSAATPASPPFSPPAPTSPVSSLPASPGKRPLPSSSPTRPGETTTPEQVVAPISNVVAPVAGFPRSHSRSSSLTSLSDMPDDHDDNPMEVEELMPAEPKKSMIPVVKRSGTPGPPPRPPTPGKTKTPFGPRTDTGIANGTTPGPSRNGVGMGLASVKKSGIPTPGPAKNGLFASSSKPAGFSASTSTAALGLGNPTTASRSALPARTRSGVPKARSLAAPTASTAAKARTKVVTAPPPSRSRITSFMKPNSTINRPPPSSSSAIVPPSVPAGTNPSPRKGQSKDDSDLPGPRRSMISQDTQASLSSLSNALEKLARPSLGNLRSAFPPRPGTSMGFVPPPRPGSSLGFAEKRATGGDLGSSAGPGASKHAIKPPSTSTAKGKAKAKETGDDATYEDSSKKVNDDPNAPLRACVIFVDVRTADGEDAGSLFVDMLRGLGAKIVSRPTPSATHFVFKSGHQATLTKYKTYEDPRPFLVGIAWVVQCVEKRARVDEEAFRVKTDEVSALDLKRRRKAELPHQMQFMARDPNPSGPKFGTRSAEANAVSKSLEASAVEVMQDAELAAERGKQRTQQKLFPRVRDRSPS
ncbi:PTCB-BRCT domain protein [Rhizoctonia solani AG-3 Rhs1AP]|uniref:PTCB-BRCT domain protein n=1 Tax=Rhizoctonia solani AG-3 Rhs1AP TaxID=1086054 RepID=X8JET2_9AGAM|nr:PTCB-BRCT domain protein [Rhizoctonia solani AG-3 Rhs1AP]